MHQIDATGGAKDCFKKDKNKKGKHGWVKLTIRFPQRTSSSSSNFVPSFRSSNKSLTCWPEPAYKTNTQIKLNHAMLITVNSERTYTQLTVQYMYVKRFWPEHNNFPTQTSSVLFVPLNYLNAKIHSNSVSKLNRMDIKIIIFNPKKRNIIWSVFCLVESLLLYENLSQIPIYM